MNESSAQRGFCRSQLRYPALLRAALAADPTKRKARPSDGYDIEHLTLCEAGRYLKSRQECRS